MRRVQCLVLFLLSLFPTLSLSAVSELNCETDPCYNSPVPEAAECLAVIDELNKRADEDRKEAEDLALGAPGVTFTAESKRQCLGCKVSQSAKDCHSECGNLLYQLTEFCTGVTLPDGYFYDPPDESGVGTITGEWSEELERQIDIAAGRCGCNGSNRARLGVGVIFVAILVTFLVVGVN